MFNVLMGFKCFDGDEEVPTMIKFRVVSGVYD